MGLTCDKCKIEYNDFHPDGSPNYTQVWECRDDPKNIKHLCCIDPTDPKNKIDGKNWYCASVYELIGKHNIEVPGARDALRNLIEQKD